MFEGVDFSAARLLLQRARQICEGAPHDHLVVVGFGEPSTGRIAPIVETARMLLEMARAAAQKSLPQESEPPVTAHVQVLEEAPTPAQPSTGPSIAGSARELLRRATASIESAARRALPRRREEARNLLARFVGIPRRIDVLRVWGVDGSEASVHAVLRWLLTPGEDHGLGDLFLRYFLARVDLSLHGRVFDFDHPLDAEVLSEFQWTMPAGSLLGAELQTTAVSGEGEYAPVNRRLRLDLLILVQDVIVAVEVKWDSDEWVYLFAQRKGDSTEMFQAQLYTKVLSLAIARSKRGSSSTGPTATEGFDFRQPMRDALSGRIGPSGASRWLGRATRVVGVLMGASEAGIGRYARGESGTIGSQGTDVRTLNWYDIAELIQQVSSVHTVSADTLDVVTTLRDSIYRHFGGDDLISAVRRLRLRMASGALVERRVGRMAIEFQEDIEVLTKCLGLNSKA